MKQQNKWEKLFGEFLELIEFTLVKYKIGDEEYNPWRWGLIDRQGANLGDIETDRFSDAEDIINRLDIYINDYLYRGLEDQEKCYEVDYEEREEPWGADSWLSLKNDKEFYAKNKEFFDDNKFTFDVLDMIANHFDEINLEHIYYEVEE